MIAFGDVYLIRNGSTSLYKIGEAKSSIKRLSTLQTGNPEKLSISKVHNTYTRKWAERWMHFYFRHIQVRGEWYNFGDMSLEQVIKEFDTAYNKSRNRTEQNIPSLYNCQPLDRLT